jgi:hypothetical protein
MAIFQGEREDKSNGLSDVDCYYYCVFHHHYHLVSFRYYFLSVVVLNCFFGLYVLTFSYLDLIRVRVQDV